MGIFLEGEDSRGDHGLGRLVEFRFKGPPGTTSPSITTHTSSGQRNCASWASQPQKSVTFLPCPGGRTTKSTKDMWWHWEKTYSENVSASLRIQHAKSMLRIILSSVARPALPCFPTIPLKRRDIRKIAIEHEMCVLIFSAAFV